MAWTIVERGGVRFELVGSSSPPTIFWVKVIHSKGIQYIHIEDFSRKKLMGRHDDVLLKLNGLLKLLRIDFNVLQR